MVPQKQQSTFLHYFKSNIKVLDCTFNSGGSLKERLDELRLEAEISVREKSKKLNIILDSVRIIKGDIELPWLDLDKAKMLGVFVSIPERDQMNLTINEQLVVELYSK